MFVVTTRLTFLKEDEPGAISVLRFKRIGRGESAINQRISMTAKEAQIFGSMQSKGEKESKDIIAGRNTVYTIED